MSEQSREFDKWFDDYEHNNDIRLAINYGAYEIAGDAWQAATAEANKRMAELEGEVAELNAKKVRHDKLVDYLKDEILEELQQSNLALQANNHDLREAFNDLAFIVKHQRSPSCQKGIVDKCKCTTCVIDRASATPAESLQAHDDLRKLCEKIYADLKHGTVSRDTMELLREALKEVK